MRYYKKKPIPVPVYTFDEFVEEGRKLCGAHQHNGMPWSFEFNGHHVTHENDQKYLINTLEGTMEFTPDAVLCVGVKGEIWAIRKDIFEETYEAIPFIGDTHG
jgi:hypothetical protein